MVLYRAVSSHSIHALRIVGVLGAYAFALATGTAVLIAAIGSFGKADSAASAAAQLTSSEVVMKHAAERYVRLDAPLVLASSKESIVTSGF